MVGRINERSRSIELIVMVEVSIAKGLVCVADHAA